MAPPLFSESTYRGLRFGFAHLFGAITGGVFFAFVFLSLLTILTILLRRRSAATVAFFLIVQFAYVLAAQGNVPVLIGSVPLVALTVFLIARFGVLAMFVNQAVFLLIFHYGASLDGTPYTVEALFPIVVVSALSLWAFRTSLGGQSAWHPALLDD
jgi:hypothetical protein